MPNNPIIENYTGKYNEIPFNLVETSHYLNAINQGLDQAYENIKQIEDNTDEPNFLNTIEAIELLSPKLDKASNLYFNMYSLHSDDKLKELSDQISPKLAKLSGDLSTNSNLEDRYISFTRNGALLSDNDKKKLQDIDEKLSLLSPKFSKNTLDAINAYELHVTDKNRVKGIPKTAIEAAAHLAKSKEKEGWIFTLQMPSYIPVIQYADDRTIRKELSTAYGVSNLDGDFDNRDVIKETVKLRKERATLLGFETHSHYILDRRMAKNPETVMSFMDNIYDIVFTKAEKEVDELRKLAKELDGIEEFMPWDFAYYSEKLKKKKFDFDSEELRPYFKAENAVEGIFAVAKKMYGIDFKEVKDVPKYHEDVNVYEVIDNDSSHLGLLYIDLFPRDTKRSGAWMNTFITQGLQDGEVRRPHILICGNLTPSTPETPSLLSFNDVNTLFHEFGHALHGLFSNVKYKSLASPNVFWDFVELPSQVMENWLLEKETLELFAKHYKTGEIIPLELIEKMKKARTFNAAYGNLRQLSLGYLDMNWHLTDPNTIDDVEAFEDKIMEKTRLFPKTAGCTSTSFGHIFAGGYSSGYYSYKWAEVLDADAFEFFKDSGIFNQEIANSFRKNILSKGDTMDPMDLYKAFRGREPDPKALLRRDGLI
ncbi:MAG: peptidase M3 [Spirochaetaceae bacterium 4572_7]|nr:MAG: peptidase M3 [Spirochaetaceae bacterium 4572_7]